MPPLEGIDVSNHNGIIEWQKVKNAGISFAFIKATEGDAYIDRFFGTNMARCRAAGIVPGPYHFYHHDIDPKAQAEHFLHVIGQVHKGDIPPALDVEAPGDGGGRITYPAAQIVSRIKTFLDTVHAATGLNCVIYTYQYVWRDLLKDSNAFANTNPLWIARYGVNSPALLGGWQKYTFWQYTDSGNVAGVGHVDRDQFNGDMAAFRLFVGDPPAVDPVRRFPAPFQEFILYGEFRKFFEAHGDVAAFGNPITNTRQELIGGIVYPYVQWFERARMEWHPEPNLNKVLLGLVGVEALAAKGRQPQPNMPISPRFANFYAANGGVDIFGLPIEPEVTEAFNGVNLPVQYFERARLEFNPQTNAVSRGLVGAEAKAARPLTVPPDAP
ncbi:MAG: lysozyme [Chloroflexia bacterium]|jgi:lysozyme|nr:lysozyme [Chloroflexia bacterium]